MWVGLKWNQEDFKRKLVLTKIQGEKQKEKRKFSVHGLINYRIREDKVFLSDY